MITFDPAYIIFFAMAVSVALMRINRTAASPIITLVNRWLRWIIFATGGAYVIKGFELTDHPYWLLVLIFGLIWFFGETLYNWMALQAYSHSDLPLFPRYEPNNSGEEWPTQKQFLKMRDEIRAAGFTHLCSMHARIVNDAAVRVSIYENIATHTRLQVTFLPQANGVLSGIISFSTFTIDDYRYVTDNTFMPYAGFYPENWLVERKPWTRSLGALLKHHRARIAKNNETSTPDTTDPIEELNANQRDIEQLNIEMGFLTPHAEREELGRITKAGLYRTWKEMWTLNYLGRAMRYL